MNRTLQQTNYIDEVIGARRAGGGVNFCLRARAGTGKTSSNMELVDDYVKEFPDDEVAMCAFGKKASDEMDEKLKKRGHVTEWTKLNGRNVPPKVQATTIHSLGFGLVRFVFKSKVNNNKVRDIVRSQNSEVYMEFGAIIEKLVHFAKLEGFGFFDDVQIGDKHAWYKLADHYNTNGFDDTSSLDIVVNAAQSIYRMSLSRTDEVDFDDMVLFPLVKNLRVKFQKRLMIVDEAQDTGRARQALVRKFVAPNGIMVVVGDDMQSIFGFAGAQTDALDQLIRGLSAKVLPLTVSWRCPVAVIKEAQTIVPDIEWAPGAKEGEILNLPELPEKMEPTDAILCRNTAPLIETAYGLLRRGIACKVEGREIGQNLLFMVNRWKRITTIDAFLRKLEEWKEREMQKALAKGKDSKAEEIEDRALTLVHLSNVCIAKQKTSLNDLRDFINEIFADDVKGVVTLCTYHRSKGREWPRVYLYQHATRCPSKWAKQEWEKEQEKHLAYVAITRSMGTLAYVG